MQRRLHWTKMQKVCRSLHQRAKWKMQKYVYILIINNNFQNNIFQFEKKGS